jgi:cell division protein FtsB
VKDPAVAEALEKMMSHPAFPAFEARVANQTLAGATLVAAWIWFRDGWDLSTIARQKVDLDEARKENARQDAEIERLRAEEKDRHREIERLTTEIVRLQSKEIN